MPHGLPLRTHNEWPGKIGGLHLISFPSLSAGEDSKVLKSSGSLITRPQALPVSLNRRTLFDVTAINHLWLPVNQRDTYWTVAIGSGAVAGIVMAAIIRSASGIPHGPCGEVSGPLCWLDVRNERVTFVMST